MFLQLDLNNNGRVKTLKRPNLSPSSIKGSKVFKNTVLRLPKSIWVLTTYQKHLCCHHFTTTTGKKKKLSTLQQSTENVSSYVWDEERSALPDPFLCCLFSAMVCEKSSVRTWHHIQKENLSLLKSPSPTPSRWETPLKVPGRLALGEKKFRSSSFQDSSVPPRPRPPSCVMLGSWFMQETQVSTEGTKGSSGTSGSQMAKVQLPFHRDRLCTKTTQLTLVLYSEQFKRNRMEW